MVASLLSSNVVETRDRGGFEMSTLCEIGKLTVRSELRKFVAYVCKIEEPGLEMVKTGFLISGINQMQTLG